MAKVCPKHDVRHGDDEKCWCCEAQEKAATTTRAEASAPTATTKPTVVATGGK